MPPTLPGPTVLFVGQVEALDPLLPYPLFLRVLGTVGKGMLDLSMVNAGYLFHRRSRLHPDGGVGHRRESRKNGYWLAFYTTTQLLFRRDVHLSADPKILPHDNFVYVCDNRRWTRF